MAYNFPISPDVRVSDIFFRTLAGFFGGAFGSLVLLIVVVLSGTFSGSSLNAAEMSPVFLFVSMAGLYLAMLISSLSSLTFFYYCDRDRYPFLLSTLTHIFILITAISLVASVLILLLSAKSLDRIIVIGVISMGICTIFSVLSMEIVANHKHLLLTLYSSAMALFWFFLLMLVLYFALGSSITFIFPLALPLCWASFGFWQVAFEMSYQWMYQLYGNDFLNASTRIGSDYIKEQRMKK